MGGSITQLFGWELKENEILRAGEGLGFRLGKKERDEGQTTNHELTPNN